MLILKILKFFPSKGCTYNNVEIWISENRREILIIIQKYLEVWTEMVIQTTSCFLENELKERNEKNVGDGNYKIKFLPVNELENFAILQDAYFTEELIDYEY